MEKSSFLAVLGFCAVVLFSVSSALAEDITIPDAGFDDHVLDAGGYIYIGDENYTGAWKGHASAGAWLDNRYYEADGDLEPRSGSNRLYGPEDDTEDYVYQILDETFIEGATYTLSVWVGQLWSGYGTGWWLYFTGEDYTDNLAEASGSAPESWEQVSLVYTATAADAGKRIGIKLQGEASTYVAFEDVTLSYSDPVPVWNIEINNPGFEAPAYADGDYGPTDGWTLGYYTVPDTTTWVGGGTDESGGYNPAADADYGGVVPEGDNLAYTSSFAGYDTGLSQILSATLQANTQYDLSVSVGNPALYNGGPTADYRIELLAGGVLLASDTGPSPLDDTWKTASLTYNSGGDPVQLGQPLEIRLLAVDFDDWYEVHFDNVTLSYSEPVPVWNDVNVVTVVELEAAVAAANPGDRINLAAGTYVLTSQIEIKSGVAYQGAGVDLTIIDGNNVRRGFVAWGDRGAADGQVDANGVAIPNLTGPTGWVIEGMTIQNCVADANNRQDILGAARDLLNSYTGAPYTLTAAQEENGGITDNPEWFDILSGGADDDLTDAELQAYLDANPVGSDGHLIANDDKKDDGGAVCILNGADGTIRNCAFSNNTAVDDGGAIFVDGSALVMVIEDCTFNLNTCGDQAGAVKLSGAASNSTVTGCSFTENSAPADDAGAIQMDGAGSAGSVYTLTGCTFTDCSALDDGGAILATADRSTYVWTDCTFIGNYVTDGGADGGAVRYAPDRADITVTNCAFIGNGMDPNGTPVGDDGGAWKTDDDDCGPVTFMNCLFAYNASKDDRVVELKAAFALLNCTFIGNEVGDEALIGVRGRDWNSTGATDENGDDIDDATTDDSIIANCLFINNMLLSNKEIIGDTRNDVFAPTVINCLFFGNLDQNSEPAINADDNSPEVGTIDVSAVTDAAQIVVDPLGDYHLVAGSPAIDASDPAAATDADIEGAPAVGVRDVGAYEFVGP